MAVQESTEFSHRGLAFSLQLASHGLALKGAKAGMRLLNHIWSPLLGDVNFNYLFFFFFKELRVSLEEYAKVPEGIWLVPLSYYPSATAESLYHCIISNHRCII